MEHITPYLTSPEPGWLQFGAARMALLDIESGFWGIRRQIESLIGPRLTNTVLQQAGANGGASFASAFGRGENTRENLLKFNACVSAYQAAGFGRFEVLDAQFPVGRVVIQASHTFEAWMVRQQNQEPQEPVCAYTAGVLVGFINTICDDGDIVCIEHTCQSQGADYCVFELLKRSAVKGGHFVSQAPDPGIGRQLNLLEILFERMPMGIAIFDREYRLQRCNPTWSEFIERDTNVLLSQIRPGVQLFELVPGLEQSMRPLFDRVLAGETVAVNGFETLLGDKVTYWDSVYSPIIENNTVAGILDVTADATARVTAYHELEQRVVERTREIQQKRRVAESLQGIIKTINTTDKLQEILEYITQIASKLMGSGACLLHKVELETDFVAIQASYGVPEAVQDVPGFPLYSSRATDQSIMHQKPIWLPDIGTSSYLKLNDSEPEPVLKKWRSVMGSNFRGFLAVPLVIREKVYGSLTFYFPHAKDFTTEEVELAESIADQAALAIETAWLRDKVEENAITAERNRLARELHDAVTQTLFSSSLIAEVLPKIWEKNPEEGMRRLDELRRLSRGALSEMRTLLLEMRPGTLAETALNDLLKHLVNAFIARTQTPVDYQFTGTDPIPVDLKIALYRIAQEALNNAAKHADASQIKIRLNLEEERAMLQISDDGRGFDLNTRDNAGMGLKIMQERADAAGILLTFESTVGHGTSIKMEKKWKKSE